MLETSSILYASTSSRTFRSNVRSEDKNNDRASCWVMVLAPSTLPPRRRFVQARAECRYSRGPDARKIARLRPQSRHDEDVRNLRQWSQNPPFDEELPDETLIAGIDLCDQTRLVVLQLSEIGKILRVVPQEAAPALRKPLNTTAPRQSRDLPPPPRTPGRRLTRSIRELNWPIDQCHGSG